ncbi:MAG: hypothetical protein HC910_11615 [Spirulinaceae cyanobacterium SM2_1_0]|nr:hypothetical protein [Spirulinaceae cyanobacterium SM2_1_0]
MTPPEITSTLTALFPMAVVQQPSADTWQVEAPAWRLLVILSEDGSWLRLLLPLVPLSAAQPYLTEFLTENFDFTQEARYAIAQDVLWGVYQHSFPTLTAADFQRAIARLLHLHETGLERGFQQQSDRRLRQIVQAAKQQGQTQAMTLQNLDRFYQEGLLGGLEQTTEERDRTLAAWRDRLASLWDQVEPDAD